jgi:hypothetical protein
VTEQGAAISPVVCHCGGDCIEPFRFAEELEAAGFTHEAIDAWCDGYYHLARWFLRLNLRGARRN